MKELNIHPIQGEILRSLLFNTNLRFSELNPNPKELTSDHFNFHIKRLSELGLIVKSDNGSYQLSTPGKEFANRFDTDTVEVEKQAKTGALVICTKQEDGVTKYLVQQRLKQPYYGYHGFLGGKITWGETIEEAASRELLEETGLNANLKLATIMHKMDYSPDDHSLLEDKFFYIFKGEDVKGKFQFFEKKFLVSGY